MKSFNDVAVIGLTGQSGAGKTTVCKVFRENGFVVINADVIARQVTEKGTECNRVLNDVFPEFFINGELDRVTAAKAVFGDRELLNLYSSIMYPYITAMILSEIREYRELGRNLILLDAPTLFEAKANDFCTMIVSVICNEETRARRIAKRDNIDEEMIRKRFSSQHDDEFYISRSDYVIYNNESEESLVATAQEVAKRIKEIYNGKAKA